MLANNDLIRVNLLLHEDDLPQQVAVDDRFGAILWRPLSCNLCNHHENRC